MKENLTIAELKSFKGLENLTEEQAAEAISSLEKISVLFFELYQEHKRAPQKVIYLKNTETDLNEDQRKAA